MSGSNFLFIHRAGYFAQFSGEQPLLMTWSLAVEEQFYIVFPLILIGLRGLTKRSLLVTLAALCALSLLVSVVMEFRSPTWNFYLPITRAWELGAGAMLAVWRSDRTATGRTSWMADAGGAAGPSNARQRHAALYSSDAVSRVRGDPFRSWDRCSFWRRKAGGRTASWEFAP